MNKRQKIIQKLPFGIDKGLLENIFHFILNDYQNLCLVCSSWNQILNDENFYEKILLKTFKSLKNALTMPFYYNYDILCYKAYYYMEIKGVWRKL